MSATVNYGWVKPTNGASVFTWGIQNNACWDAADADLKIVADSVNSKLDANAVAVSAAQLQTARNFSLTGVVTASAVSFNGSGNVALATAIADGALSIAKTSGLQTALDAKEPTLDADRKRKITISTADPSGGADGDIWFKYTA